MFFTVMWRGLCQALGWFFGLFGYKRYTTTESVYAADDKEKLRPLGKQIQFAGLFPVGNPRYCICIVANTNSLDASPADLGDVVNPLTKWLLKR